MDPNSLSKKVFWKFYDAPFLFLFFGGGGWHGRVAPLDPLLQPVGTNQTNQATSSVRSQLAVKPKFVDLCGRRHPEVNTFPLSHVIFKVNFLLSNDSLALVSAKRQQQRFNESLSQVKDLELSWAMNSSVFNDLATRVSDLRWCSSLTTVGSRQAAKWSEMKLVGKVLFPVHAWTLYSSPYDSDFAVLRKIWKRF